MASFWIFSIQLLLLISVASASHFTAGTVRVVPKEKHLNGSIKVDIYFRQTYGSCNHYFGDWRCLNGNCGKISEAKEGVIDSSTNAAPNTNGWCETEEVQSRYYPNDDSFDLRKASCCWIPTVNLQGSWRLFTHVDLRERSDNWQANGSPNNAIMPFLRVPSNCPRSYHLMTDDPDGDRVICRYGTILNRECATCNQPQGFELDERNCVLHYRSTSYTGTYGFELVLEDFPRTTISLISTNGTSTQRLPLPSNRNKRSIFGNLVLPYIGATAGPTTTTAGPTTTTASPTTTTAGPTTTTAGLTTTTAGPTTTPYQTYPSKPYPTPLSQIPLQFSVLVDSPAPSCTEGEYLPRFVHPTPSHGDHLNAQVNEEFEITVKAVAQYSKVGDIIFTGPLGTTKHRIERGEFYLRWTPTLHQFGDQVPICFIAEAAFSYQQLQSEMRCVWVHVEHAKAHVICNETSMTVELEKAAFKGLDEDHLRLNDPGSTACRLHSNSTHVIGFIPLNECGTMIKEDDENLLFSNEITTFEDVRDIVTRKHLLEVQFSCQYPKRGNVSLGFTVHRDNQTITEKGFGTFTYNFEFYPDIHFDTMINPHFYPLDYEVGDKIYMQIDATTSINNTVLFVESCSASPYDNPNYQPTYPIIENGCVQDSTVVLYPPSHNKQFRFSIDAFKFIGLHDQVYISCSVILCEAGNPNTRCSRGCLPTNPIGRRRRSAVIETGAHFISQGPLRLQSTPENKSSVTGLNLNMAFIAGCLLAAIAMICGVMIHKFKRAAVRYQPLSSIEQ
ncbi:CUB and zona pellucida-like domain-containing protein 1 [Gadus chalcogrammus]|uniref:CUB and zona pellucida-like domain-containing protein 1 n=1 Tax=Gadus chalcogrammus TaxID=1042646 RepID=UPI0024C47D8D|nr:CUB and zona pellucida-like domain-containing protein 1 [Gadus chalcogrammus]